MTTVLVTAAPTRKTYHTNDDCPALTRSSEIIEKPKERFAHLSECKICQHDGTTHGKDPEYEETECDLCGETYKELCYHLQNCPERGGMDE